MVMMQSAGAAVSTGRPRRGMAMNPVRLIVATASVIALSVNVVNAQKLPTNWPDYLGGRIALTIRRSSRSLGPMSASSRLRGVIRLETVFIRSVR